MNKTDFTIFLIVAILYLVSGSLLGHDNDTINMLAKIIFGIICAGIVIASIVGIIYQYQTLPS